MSRFANDTVAGARRLLDRTGGFWMVVDVRVIGGTGASASGFRGVAMGVSPSQLTVAPAF